MVREIVFSVGLDSISPGNRQIVGMQRESNATTIKFIVEEAVRSKMDTGNLKYRFEAIDSLGSVDFGELKDFMWEEGSETRQTFEYVIPEPLTRNGGNSEVYLIIACFNESGDCLYEWRSRPAKLTFVGVENDGGAMDKERDSLSALASQATSAAKISEELRAFIEAGIADGTFRGVSGVHVGTEPPEDDDVNVWIDPSGDDTLLSVTVEETENGHIVKITDANGEHSFKVLNGKDGIQSDSDIPDYWKESLKEGAEDINTALCEAGQNKSSFLFYSDAHWDCKNGGKMAPTLLKYLYRNTGITKTFFGGDIVNSQVNTYDSMSYLWEWRKQLKDLPNHHSVVGNHDEGNSPDNVFTQEYVYGYLMAAEETPDIVRGDNMYYYIDSPSEKTRYLFLDTASPFVWNRGNEYANNQRAFVNEALITTPDNWHIVAIAHIWFSPDYSSTVVPIPVLELSEHSASYDICQMFDGYNSRANDYLNCKAKVEFCIGGHIHRDYVGFTDGGIPIVLVETDSSGTRGNFTHTKGTSTESSVNGIIADYNTNTLKVIRIGRGNSFETNLSSREIITYYSVTNKLTGVTTSSKVSNVKQGDSFETTLSTTTAITSVNITMGGENITDSVYNSETGIITIDSVMGDIVITAVAVVDEEIVNQIPISTDKDGNVYDGDGYKNGYRINSLGEEKQENNTELSVTGFIPFGFYDALYLSLDMFDGTSGYYNIVGYDSDKNIILYDGENKLSPVYINNSYGAVVKEDDVYIFYLENMEHSERWEDVAYVRVTGKITADSIITVNQPI